MLQVGLEKQLGKARIVKTGKDSLLIYCMAVAPHSQENGSTGLLAFTGRISLRVKSYKERS